MSRTKIIRAVNERWPHQFPDEVEPEILIPLDQYDEWVLVERSTITGDHHLSVHPTMDALIDYQTHQEEAGDWEPRVAVNLLTGKVTELERTFDVEVLATGNTVETYEDWRR